MMQMEEGRVSWLLSDLSDVEKDTIIKVLVSVNIALLAWFLLLRKRRRMPDPDEIQFRVTVKGEFERVRMELEHGDDHPGLADQRVSAYYQTLHNALAQLRAQNPPGYGE